MHPSRYLPRDLPTPLEGLADLALDLRWSWNHSADELWETIDPQLWNSTGDPWLILESVSQTRLEELANDTRFVSELQTQVETRANYLQQPSWFEQVPGAGRFGTVAYFSMEFGLSEALPVYSGGLGILAGDHLKTASDLGVPLVGVGLLYQQGYFRQALDASGNQLSFFPFNNPTMLPVLPLRDPEGEWLRVTVELPGRTLQLRGWEASVGRVRLYLLDSNDLLNSPGDRGITGELYGGGSEMRLQQEIVLGIGGWRLLQALGLRCDVCHLNEGHAAFVVLERARQFMDESGQAFATALCCTRAGNAFTTHTPVEAGFDRFEPALMRQYFTDYAAALGVGIDELLALGGTTSASSSRSFNMAYLAVRGSAGVNAVSRLHGAVSRRIFQPLFPRWPAPEVPVSHVTNGVHVPSWDSTGADELWTRACGKQRWMGALETTEEDFRTVSDKELWELRSRGRSELVQFVRQRLARERAAKGAPEAQILACTSVLDPNVLTVGFARRFATYKRPDLLLYDPGRLTRLLTDPGRPVQLVIAGKAHPRDGAGQAMIRRWSEYLRQAELCDRAAFLEDYDMSLAAELVRGVDLWLNTPRRPWEACGTSGMKVLVNGGLNLSELDGWWAEAYREDAGWALGDGAEHGADPDWDGREAQQLYRLLEEEVVPAFYERNDEGLPARWTGRMRESMASLTPGFSANRMVRQYVEQHYLPAAEEMRARAADDARLARELCAWRSVIDQYWSGIRFGPMNVQRSGGWLRFSVQIFLDELASDAVRAQIYADGEQGEKPTIIAMERGEPLAGSVNGYTYDASVVTERPAEHFTARVVPYHVHAYVPLEVDRIAWQR